MFPQSDLLKMYGIFIFQICYWHPCVLFCLGLNHKILFIGTFFSEKMKIFYYVLPSKVSLNYLTKITILEVSLEVQLR